ncbi:uncharacterized protein M6B38_338605 [Iris pallida]|uniref:AMP-activated protein kinase glycogen-binding domain-containing protein n=1 Tax=Iris pallida TaxID=29817 RepID=A0AAX6GZ07_IRIPA|nr:uncharacterized protein M6B38_338605 [Iris pallida]
MDCLKASAMRSVELEFVFPNNKPFERLWGRARRFSFMHHASHNASQYCGCTGMIYSVQHTRWRHSSSRAFAGAVSLDKESSSLSEGEQLSKTSKLVPEDASEDLILEKVGSDELKSLLADSERSKLIRKLSDANQYNRFLKRQLQTRDDALIKFKSELAVLELELLALVGLAEEVANSNAQLSSRKINGKYIHSHLLSRLQATHKKLKEQIKDDGALRFEEVTLYWVGMAESVQVMGSFDGWSRGEEMSQDYSGDFARFSATLKLRPGRYEIKFLVDGQWRLSPEFPTVGEGLTENNLLVVE